MRPCQFTRGGRGAGCGFTWEHGALVLDPPTAEGRLPPARPSYGRLRARHPDCGRTSAVVALAGKPYWGISAVVEPAAVPGWHLRSEYRPVLRTGQPPTTDLR